jgi:hypothetical protein
MFRPPFDPLEMNLLPSTTPHLNELPGVRSLSHNIPEPRQFEFGPIGNSESRDALG